ncbi:TetR/AcrR family transcriptional regulator [Rhodococcoides yunnanense]|uniref:TetR/AcrR family transcriptional regulator n=1 Tax=Rhodococcoides yunnanense TaxID=278209 RepID=UPI000932FE5D|nr:TetR/AcrR family transcriptional regulator [Rhodococcus yunnanensis]
MGTREENSEARREAVLRATGTLLDEVGVAALTIREVALRAGVAQGTVFLYADNKAHLVNQVFGQRIADKWHALFTESEGKRPLDRVEHFYLGCVDIFYADLANVQALYRALASHDGGRLDSVDRVLERVHSTLKDAALQGDLVPDSDVDVLALSYQGLYSNIIQLAAVDTPHAEAKRIIGESMRQLRNGVATTKSGR